MVRYGLAMRALDRLAHLPMSGRLIMEAHWPLGSSCVLRSATAARHGSTIKDDLRVFLGWCTDQDLDPLAAVGCCPSFGAIG